MNIALIKARDLPEAWFLAVKKCLTEGREYTISKGSFEGTKRKEFEFVVVEIEHPGVRPLAPWVPDGVPAPASEEYIESYFSELLNPEKAEHEHYRYGECISDTQYNQVEEVIRRYKQWGHDTNRCCMSVGSKQSIFLYRREEETGEQASSQCLRVVDTAIRDGALHFYIYFRSWDLYAGFPVNLGGLQLLKEYMSEQIGVGDGSIVACSKGLHLYSHSWEAARSAVGL